MTGRRSPAHGGLPGQKRAEQVRKEYGMGEKTPAFRMAEL